MSVKRLTLLRIPDAGGGYYEQFKVAYIQDWPLRENEVVELHIDNPVSQPPVKNEPRVKSVGIIVWHQIPSDGNYVPDVCATPKEAYDIQNFWNRRGGRCFLTPQWGLE